MLSPRSWRIRFSIGVQSDRSVLFDRRKIFCRAFKALKPYPSERLGVQWILLLVLRCCTWRGEHPILLWIFCSNARFGRAVETIPIDTRSKHVHSNRFIETFQTKGVQSIQEIDILAHRGCDLAVFRSMLRQAFHLVTAKRERRLDQPADYESISASCRCIVRPSTKAPYSSKTNPLCSQGIASMVREAFVASQGIELFQLSVLLVPGYQPSINQRIETIKEN